MIDVFGPYDLNTLYMTQINDTTLGQQDTGAVTTRKQLVYMFSGLDTSSQLEQIKTFCTTYSPKTYVSAQTVPTLIFQGTADTTVPKTQSDALNADLTSNGVEHDYTVYTGGVHGFDNFSDEDITTMLNKILPFITEHLR